MFWSKIWRNEKFCLILINETTNYRRIDYGTARKDSLHRC